MIIPIVKIPPEGLDLSFEKDKQWLIENLRDKDELKNFLGDKIKCECSLRMIKDQVLINAVASLSLEPVCFRCGKDFKKEIRAKFDMACIPDSRKKAHRGQEYMDGDVGMNYYSNGEIDLATICREQVFLTVPMTFLCKEECKGLCYSCGADLNEEDCPCEK